MHNDMENGTQFYHAVSNVAGVWIRTPPPGLAWGEPWKAERASGLPSQQKASPVAEAYREVSGN